MKELKKIFKLQRLENSKMGNPRYNVIFDDRTEAKTQVNAGFVYSIDGSWEGKAVTVKYNQKGLIEDLKLFN
jgi:hypothetical protein